MESGGLSESKGKFVLISIIYDSFKFELYSSFVTFNLQCIHVHKQMYLQNGI